MTTLQEKPIIAFDESGNTGSDLLDLDQPVFILSSVRLTNSQAVELKNLIKSPAKELKFNRLKKYGKYHSQILELLNHEFISADTVNIGVFHKAYCICAYTADRLVEPLVYRTGMDFYEGGENIAYTNLLYFCTPAFCDNKIFKKYQVAFLTMFQKRDKKSIDDFYSVVKSLIDSSKDEKYKDALLPILESHQIIDDILDGWDNNNFDTTLSSFINIIDYWGRKTTEHFDAFVDNSKALQHFKHYVDRVKSINIHTEIGADRRTLQLPLKLNDIIFTDSKENVAVQIADLIAGAANHYFRSLADPNLEDELSIKIGESKISNLLNSPVWPTPSVTPEDLDTVHNGKTNVLDSMTNLIWDKE